MWSVQTGTEKATNVPEDEEWWGCQQREDEGAEEVKKFECDDGNCQQRRLVATSLGDNIARLHFDATYRLECSPTSADTIRIQQTCFIDVF